MSEEARTPGWEGQLSLGAALSLKAAPPSSRAAQECQPPPQPFLCSQRLTYSSPLSRHSSCSSSSRKPSLLIGHIRGLLGGPTVLVSLLPADLTVMSRLPFPCPLTREQTPDTQKDLQRALGPSLLSGGWSLSCRSRHAGLSGRGGEMPPPCHLNQREVDTTPQAWSGSLGERPQWT